MTVTQELVDAAKKAALTQARVLVSQGEQSFMTLFGNFISKDDLVRFKDLWAKAVESKASQFMASTDDEAQQHADEYEAYMDAIEELGTGFEIVAKAKAGVFVRSVAHQVIAGAFAVAGAVLQAGLGIVLPGVGSLIGAGANAGIQHVVNWALGG